MGHWRITGGVLLVLLLFTNTSYAQLITIIEGYVVNRETGAPVSYATISLPEQKIGISANLNGYFYLQIGSFKPTDHLEVSSIGFKKYVAELGQFDLKKQVSIQLQPRTTFLEEVVVRGETMKANELLNLAARNLKKHLGSKPYLMNGLYREIFKINKKYAGFTEGTAMFYLDGYHKDHNTSGSERYTYDLAQWKQMRRSDYQAPDSLLLPPYLIIPKLFKAKDFYLYEGPLQRNHFSDFTYKIDSLTIYEDQLVYVVDFQPNSGNRYDYQGKLYLKEDDYALMAIEIAGQPDRKLCHAARNEYVHDLNHKFRLNYTLFQGHYYISHLSLDYTYQIDIDGETHEVAVATELVGGQFSDQKAEVLNYGQMNVLYGEMLNPLINYDSGFWNTFPYAYGPGEAVFSDLGDVSEQFQLHHNQRLVPLPKDLNNYQELYEDKALFDVFFQDF